MALTVASLLRDGALAEMLTQGAQDQNAEASCSRRGRTLRSTFKRFNNLPPTLLQKLLSSMEPRIYTQHFWNDYAETGGTVDIKLDLTFALNVTMNTLLPLKEHPMCMYWSDFMELCTARCTAMGARLKDKQLMHSGGYYSVDQEKSTITRCVLDPFKALDLGFSVNDDDSCKFTSRAPPCW